MTMNIQLTPEALEALFPEGSQARIELQNTVMTQFAKKSFAKHTMPLELRKELISLHAESHRALHSELKEALHKAGLKRESDYQPYTLRQSMKDTIGREVSAAVLASVAEQTKHFTAEQVVSRAMNNQLAVAMRNSIERTVQNFFIEHVDKADFQEKIDKAMQAFVAAVLQAKGIK